MLLETLRLCVRVCMCDGLWGCCCLTGSAGQLYTCVWPGLGQEVRAGQPAGNGQDIPAPCRRT